MTSEQLSTGASPSPAGSGAPNVLTFGARLVAQVLEPMKRAFVGKDEIIDLMGVCLAAGENLFLLGPPGTAKSALVHELGRRLHGRTFEYLLTRFTEPNELFGPFDIRKLRDGELITNTEGMLPEASLVFLDELLNANSAILNSLLGVLNERVFRRGRETRALPTLMVVGASNRLPEEDALAALFDRFLIRVVCDNVPGEHLGEVLSAGWQLDLGLHRQHHVQSGAGAQGVDVEDVRKLHQQLHLIDLTDVRPVLLDLVARLRHAGIAISDRRAVKLQRLVAASAMLASRSRATPSDIWVFRYIWDTVDQQEVQAAVVHETLARIPPDPADHPRARGDDAPDAEAMARDLQELANEVTTVDPAERTAMADRLGLLAGRCQWVKDERQRSILLERVEELWKHLGTNSQ
jgi:MoxR-like ATPase